jgi:hypothetical protein
MSAAIRSPVFLLLIISQYTHRLINVHLKLKYTLNFFSFLFILQQIPRHIWGNLVILHQLLTLCTVCGMRRSSSAKSRCDPAKRDIICFKLSFRR